MHESEEHLLEVVNQGARAVLISIGRRTGLFDVMSRLGASTSDEIAAAAGLAERPVREWLGGMVVSGFVQHDASRFSYALTPGPSAFLVSSHLADLTHYVAQLAALEDQVVAALVKKEGVPAETYARLSDVIEDAKARSVERVIVEVLPRVPNLVTTLRSGIDVLDVGCGRGRAVAALATAFPASRFVGIDRTEQAFVGGDRVRFEVRDPSKMDDEGRYDLITSFCALPTEPAPQALLAALARALRPTGALVMQEVSASSRLDENVGHPLGPLLYALSTIHSVPSVLAQRGEALGALCGEERAHSMLREAGFATVAMHKLDHDIQHDYYVATLR